MLNRTRREELAQEMADIYALIEDQILLNIAKRIKKHRSLFTEEGYEAWQMIMLAELDQLTADQIKLISSYSDIVVEEVTRMLSEAGYVSADSLTDDVMAAYEQGAPIYNPSKVPDDVIGNVVAAYRAQALDKFNFINTTMIGTSADTYKEILNRSTALVLAGTTSITEAQRVAIKEAAASGVAGLIDKAGRRWTPEAYVNTVMRSTIGNTARAAQDAGMDHHGIPLIEVSQHMGARPKCAPYQGKIFSREGYVHPTYPSITETSYGEPAGLFGINCGHVSYPYIEGYTIHRDQPIETEANDEAYKLSQQQRAIERGIRAAKREEAMLRVAGDPEGAAEAKAKVKALQKTMRGFIEETGRTRRRNREQIYGA